MRMLIGTLLVGGFLLAASSSRAQQPPPGGGNPPPRSSDANVFAARLMVFDRNEDGKLTRDEVTDQRLLPLFDRADTDKDGVVSKDDLLALFTKEGATLGAGGRGGPGGPGGPGRFGGPPPRPGQIMPPFLVETLGLSDDQKTKLAELQREVDARLESILTDDQKKQLREMADRGPGGFGPPGRFGPPGDGGPAGGRPRRP